MTDSTFKRGSARGAGQAGYTTATNEERKDQIPGPFVEFISAIIGGLPEEARRRAAGGYGVHVDPSGVIKRWLQDRNKESRKEGMRLGNSPAAPRFGWEGSSPGAVYRAPVGHPVSPSNWP